jgi:hypothetical protein
MLGFARIEFAFEAVVKRFENCRCHQIRIKQRIDGAKFDPARGRDPDGHGAVLKTPVGEDRSPISAYPKPKAPLFLKCPRRDNFVSKAPANREMTQRCR